MAEPAFTFELKGTAEVLAKIQAEVRSMSGKAEAALYQEAEREMTESKKRVPVDTGTLRNSGHVQPPERTADGISVTMGYGGAAEDYAIPVHEIPPSVVQHTVGQWKYLESVLKESAPYLLERIASRIKV